MSADAASVEFGGETPDLEASLVAAQKELSACIFSNSWTFTLAGVVGAVPASIYLKTYSPLIAVSVLGNAADYFRGVQKCRTLRERVTELEQRRESAKQVPDS